MTRFLKPVFLAACLAFAGATTALAESQPTLTVTGTGEVSATPDQARFSFGVHSTDVDAAKAMAINKATMTRAFAALRDSGVAGDSIRTTGVSLNPRYEHYNKGNRNTPPRITGYEAHNTVSVTVDDIDRLGAILDALVSSGVNGLQQVQYRIADPSDLEAQARAAAASAARAKAEAYAQAIGTKITGIVSMSESAGRAPQPMMRMEAASAAPDSLPMSGGTQTVTAQLHVVFALSGLMD